ncbi:MAG: RNA 2',3'-cyclic phosphodiesterase [Nitrososphaerota archaeon]|nr:RNA 2',3'-cyclic phosphodiesterase [Candidatus Bathyarchaeota archaeon]MDW8048534.1 RNA 2',3'-cyclic phosphodiesterase [Nitrososphaerota archaeon]
MESIRAFISFDVEEDVVIRNIEDVQEMLINTGASLRLTKPENIHITIRFLGEIPFSMVDEIHGEMEKIDFRPFDIKIKGLGAFPNLRKISVIWAGISEGVNELRSIFYQLESAMQNLGFKPDPKGFSPHLTIARLKSGRNKEKLAEIIRELEDYEFGCIKAQCLRLKRSILTPNGPIYSVLRETCRS